MLSPDKAGPAVRKEKGPSAHHDAFGLGLGGGNLSGDFGGEVVNALFDAFADDEERVAGDLGAGSLHEFARRTSCRP